MLRPVNSHGVIIGRDPETGEAKVVILVFETDLDTYLFVLEIPEAIQLNNELADALSDISSEKRKRISKDRRS